MNISAYFILAMGILASNVPTWGAVSSLDQKYGLKNKQTATPKTALPPKNAQTANHGYPLHDAIKAGKPSAVKAALTPARKDEYNSAGLTPLMVAAMYDRSTSARTLLAAGADADLATTQYATTALMMAAMNGYHEVVAELIAGGANPDVRNKSGFTALMLAAQKGHVVVVRQLLQAGAKTDIQDAAQRTAMQHATSEEIKQLLASSLPPVTPKTPVRNGPVLQVPIAGTDKTLTFPADLWARVKEVNTKLEQSLEPADYQYLLVCQLFWHQDQERKKQQQQDEEYLGGLEDSFSSVDELVLQLEKIAANPDTVKQYTSSVWEKNEEQGVRSREYITDLQEEYVAANDDCIVGMIISDTYRYSFWDARTGRLINRWNNSLFSPEYSKDGYYWMQEVNDEIESVYIPFLGNYPAEYMSEQLLINPRNGDVRSVICARVGMDDTLAEFPTDNEFVSMNVLHESDAKGWELSGAELLGLKEPKVWSNATAGWASEFVRIDSNFYAKGHGHFVTCTTTNDTAFTIDFSRLSIHKTKPEPGTAKISPAWVKLQTVPQLAERQAPMLATLCPKETHRLTNQAPIRIAPNNRGIEQLRCSGLPIASENVSISFMSDWASQKEEALASWGPWVMAIHRGDECFLASEDGKLIAPQKYTLKEESESKEKWPHALPLYIEEKDDTVRVLGNTLDSTAIYSINLATKTWETVKEWPCAMPDKRRAFFVPELRILAQPLDSLRYELLKLDDKWDTEKVADMFISHRGDYAIVLPNGQYAGSPGCEKMLEFAQDEHVLSMQALAPWRNRPAEVLQALGGNPDDIAALQATTKRWLRKLGYDESALAHEPALQDFPIAEVAMPKLNETAETTTFNVTLKANRKAITALHVRADGVKIPQTWENDLLVPAGQESTVTVGVPLAIGQNWIEITPIDSMGISGNTERFRVIHSGKYESELYVVALGVSDYVDDSLDLQYAAKDARDIAACFQKHGNGRVRTLTLTDKEVSNHAVLEKVKAFLAAASIHDRVVLYIAGHGMLDDKLDYYYAPHHFDTENIAETGISLEALVSCLQQAAPRKRILLMDTCHSGQLGEAGEEQLAANGVQLPHGVRAIQNRGMKVRKSNITLSTTQTKRYIEDMFSLGDTYRGINIIAGAAGAEYALESTEWQNGVFCASLCNNLDGRADYNKDGLTTLGELQDAVASQVRKLTGGKQNISLVAVESEDVFLCGQKIIVSRTTSADYEESAYEPEPAPAPPTHGMSTPLHAAVLAGKPSEVQAALGQKQHLEARDEADMTPLMLAAAKDRSTSTRLLIKAGANPNAANSRYGTTALMLAAMNGHHEVVTELIAGGAQVNATNKSNTTALILAAQKGHLQVVRQLLQAGADKNMRDSSGKSAVDYATPAVKSCF